MTTSLTVNKSRGSWWVCPLPSGRLDRCVTACEAVVARCGCRLWTRHCFHTIMFKNEPDDKHNLCAKFFFFCLQISAFINWSCSILCTSSTLFKHNSNDNFRE